MNRGNFRKVHRNTCTWAKEKKQQRRERKRERGREREVFQKRPAIYETEWKRVLEGARRPPPLIPPLNIAISTSQLHSAIPHFKGKISGRLSLRTDYTEEELASRTTPARMENNATSCSWQLVSFPSPIPSLEIFFPTTEIPDDPSDRVFLCIKRKIFDSSVRISLFGKKFIEIFRLSS